MKKLLTIFALLSTLFAQPSSAQVIKGDMNDDGMFNITDVSESVNTVLGKRAIQYVQGSGDPYSIDNSRVAGTWYKSKSVHFTLNADGSTDYNGAATYCFMPYQGRIVFFGTDGAIVSALNVIVVGDGRMTTNVLGSGDFETWTNKVPVQQVTSIQLSSTNLEVFVGEVTPITATVLPEDADNKSVEWESSNELVAKIVGNIVFSFTSGTAVITCRATDGSGVKAECTVTAKKRDVSHDYVDLGLPSGVLWATCNIGAGKPEDYGLYFAWGDTKGYAKGESHAFIAENYSQKDIDYLMPEDDAATANWGDGWRTPSLKEIQELYDSKYTSSEWVTLNGVYGRKITSKSNDNSIFLPAAGYRDSNLFNEGSYGQYWSRDIYSGNGAQAYGLRLNKSFMLWGNFNCYQGCNVRAVRVPSE